MPKNHRVIFVATSATAVAAAQTLTAAGSLTLNGTSANTYGPYIGSTRFDRFNRKLTLTSAGNLSAVNFTITGMDTNNNIVTEVIAGPNATTVTTVNLYNRVLSIVASAAVASAITVGNDSIGNSATIPLDVRVAKFIASCAANVTGTINYTLQHTFDNPLDPTYANSLTWANCPDAVMVAASTNQSTSYTSPVAAVRFVVNSSSDGTLNGIVIEEGYNS